MTLITTNLDLLKTHPPKKSSANPGQVGLGHLVKCWVWRNMILIWLYNHSIHGVKQNNKHNVGLVPFGTAWLPGKSLNQMEFV